MHKNTDEEMAALYLGRASGKKYLCKDIFINKLLKSNVKHEFRINLEYKEVKEPRVLYIATDHDDNPDIDTACLRKRSIFLIVERNKQFKGFIKMVEEVKNDDY